MTLSPIKPADFTWFPYEGFTFCLGLADGDAAWTSGHTSAAHDPAVGKMTVSGTMTEQARIAYTKVLAILEAAGFGPEDVVQVTENLTVAGIPDYPLAAQVRGEMLPGCSPTVTTVVVERLVRRAALLEVEMHAIKGGGRELRAASEARQAGSWTASAIREADGEVYLPTLLPVDERGELVRPGDFVGQYAYCLERAGALLSAVGLSLDQAVVTHDYSTPASRDAYPDAQRVRRELLGGAGVLPAAGGILTSRLHHPEALVALDVTASRHPLELVNPGWAGYAEATHAPAVRAGRMLYLSGFAATDPVTRNAMPAGDIGGQAEVVYSAVLELLRYAGLGPADLLRTIEFCVESALPDYRAVAAVRGRLLSPPWPASTGDICLALPGPDLLLEVFPIARYPEDRA
jgi:enamine deaminase RidA (YjgF/YER057c/UK114 family)